MLTRPLGGAQESVYWSEGSGVLGTGEHLWCEQIFVQIRREKDHTPGVQLVLPSQKYRESGMGHCSFRTRAIGEQFTATRSLFLIPVYLGERFPLVSILLMTCCRAVYGTQAIFSAFCFLFGSGPDPGSPPGECFLDSPWRERGNLDQLNGSYLKRIHKEKHVEPSTRTV